MGAGQFCTNHCLVIAIAGAELDAFIEAAGAALSGSNPVQMLTPGIHASFEQGVQAHEKHDAVTMVARGCVGEGADQARGALFRTDAPSFLVDRALGREVFGSLSIVVAVADMAEASKVIAALEGQLTATLMLDPADEPMAASLIPLISRKVGRILANSWPTGVEVSHAMVHDGPFPAASDGRSTSVGTLAIERFLRPVCYQNLSDVLLPTPLQSANPSGLTRCVDGVVTSA